MNRYTVIGDKKGLVPALEGDLCKYGDHLLALADREPDGSAVKMAINSAMAILAGHLVVEER